MKFLFFLCLLCSRESLAEHLVIRAQFGDRTTDFFISDQQNKYEATMNNSEFGTKKTTFTRKNYFFVKNKILELKKNNSPTENCNSERASFSIQSSPIPIDFSICLNKSSSDSQKVENFLKSVAMTF